MLGGSVSATARGIDVSAGRPDPRPRAAPNPPAARWLWLMPPSSTRTLAEWALLPLRAFLRFTFCFAGLQKLANPAFFEASNPASIQAQMAGAARRSPIHALISPLAHHAALIGAVIAVGEVAVGVGALLGLLTRIAAVGGLLLSFNLFLAVSFHTSPYYTGSDIVFVFAWMPLIIAGGGLLSLDALIANVIAARQSWSGAPLDVDRRRVLGAVTLAAGAVAIVGAGAITGLARLFNNGSSAAASDQLLNGSASAAPGSSAPPSSPDTGAVHLRHRRGRHRPRLPAPRRLHRDTDQTGTVANCDHGQTVASGDHDQASNRKASGQQDRASERSPRGRLRRFPGSGVRRPGHRRAAQSWHFPRLRCRLPACGLYRRVRPAAGAVCVSVPRLRVQRRHRRGRSWPGNPWFAAHYRRGRLRRTAVCPVARGGFRRHRVVSGDRVARVRFVAGACWSPAGRLVRYWGTK